MRVPLGDAPSARCWSISSIRSSAPRTSPRADSYLEDPLRLLLHLIMSQPEYQLG